MKFLFYTITVLLLVGFVGLLGFYTGFETGLDKRPLRENIIIVEETDKSLIFKSCEGLDLGTSTIEIKEIFTIEYVPQFIYNTECEEETQNLKEEFELCRGENKRLSEDLAIKIQALKDQSWSIKEGIVCK